MRVYLCRSVAAIAGQEGGFSLAIMPPTNPAIYFFDYPSERQAESTIDTKSISLDCRVGAVDVFWPDPVLFDEIAKVVWPGLRLQKRGVPVLFRP